MNKKYQPLSTGVDWSYDLLHEYYNHIERIGCKNFKLNIYPNQIEIISSEQMLEAYCITPDHKLLKDDLTWIESGNVKNGDIILGFDEHGPHRKYRASTITSCERDVAEVFEVTLSSGKKFKVTKEHQWLVRINKGKACVLTWKTTDNLQCQNNPTEQTPSQIPKLFDMWEINSSREAGWLAGLFDGEGNIVKDGLYRLTVSQRPGIILERTKSTLSTLGIEFSITEKPNSDVLSINILGDVTKKVQILGELYPHRLVNKLKFDSLGTLYTTRHNCEEPVSIISLGQQEIVKLSTSTGTFVCDGYPMHNSTHAMPLYYEHWSTGMQFVEELERYKRGMMGLAYEVVINSSPCIAYLMEENTMLMQILVMAHASMGHNHFYKNNYLFRQWTDAESIVDYLVFVRKYVRECEEKYGVDTVEEVLDACHALKHYGINKYKRPPQLTQKEEERERIIRDNWIQSQLNDIWRTVPHTKQAGIHGDDGDVFPEAAHENVLYFIEKNAPNTDTWKRELIRIVRKLSQNFYPNMQTRLMNEGFACFTHYHIMCELYEQGLITDGYMMEFLTSHTNVILQPPYDSQYYSGINVYALGFAMYMEIKRISVNPTEEDKRWFKHKDWIGNGKWLENILWAAANFKDESFILEFLTPKLIRDFKLFVVVDDDQDTKYEVAAIHNDDGYKRVRESLAKQYDLSTVIPEIQVAKGGVDRWGTRSLTLEHIVRDRRPLDEETATETLKHANVLWGYDVKLRSVDNSHNIKAMYEIGDKKTLLDVFIDDDT